MEFTVVRGDIADQSADALVNAAGTSLRMGSGVAGALRRAAGDRINDAAVAEGPIDLGATAVTDAYALDADYVIHAAAMPHYGDGQATRASVELAAHNSLRRADRLGCESLVVPALGCGVAGFELREGARIIAGAIRDYDSRGLGEVRVIGYGEEAETIREAVESA